MRQAFSSTCLILATALGAFAVFGVPMDQGEQPSSAEPGEAVPDTVVGEPIEHDTQDPLNYLEPQNGSATETSAATSSPASTDPRVLVVGDSILEGLRLSGKSFGYETVYDSEVSRSIWDLEAALDNAESAGSGLPGRVVIHLGSNGWWPDAELGLEASVERLSSSTVVLVNVAVDRPWAAAANAAIDAVADRHENVVVVDWKSAATPDLLRSDEVHPNTAGIESLHTLILEALGMDARSALPAGVMAP